MEAPLFEDNELEKAIGLKYNLDVTPTDLANFDHYTAAQKQFLVSFTLRWRNKALDKTKAVLQNAFQMIHDRVRANKHAALVKQNAELLQNSLDILLSPKDAAHERTPENVNLITEWLHKIRISNEKLHLSDEQLKILATSMDALSLDASETLFIQGDSGKRDYYYWIVTGAVGMFSSHSAAAEVALRSKFKIWNRKTPLSVESTADLGDLIATFHDGDGFGELAGPCTAGGWKRAAGDSKRQRRPCPDDAALWPLFILHLCICGAPLISRSLARSQSWTNRRSAPSLPAPRSPQSLCASTKPRTTRRSCPCTPRSARSSRPCSS